MVNGSRSPARPDATDDMTAAISAVAEAHGNRPDALLEIYHDIQERLGHIPEVALPIIARALNISRAEARGVFTFYHDFRAQPAGRHVVKLCRAEACQAMGCRQLEEHLTGKLGIRMSETTPNGAITLEAVYCLGNCALSPAVMIDGKLIGRVSAERIDALLCALDAGGAA